MHFLLFMFVFGVLLMILEPLCRRAEQQRQAAAFEASKILLDVLPEDARERVLVGIRERAEPARQAEAARAAKIAANKADLKRQAGLAVALIAFALIYSAIVTFIY
jgi:hypothetical protein